MHKFIAHVVWVQSKYILCLCDLHEILPLKSIVNIVNNQENRQVTSLAYIIHTSHFICEATNSVGVHIASMAEQLHEARDNLPNEAESSTSMYMALLKEMRAINTNTTSMHDDINNLVVVNEDSDMPVDVHEDVADGEAEREGTDTASVVSVDTRVEHLLTSTQTSQEESATTS